MPENYNPVLEAYLSDFLKPNPISAKRKILSDHGDVLLTQEAEDLLGAYTDRARRQRQPSLAAYETHLRFLSECRKYGIDSVFGAMERAKSIVQDPVVQETAQKAAILMQDGPQGRSPAELQDAIAIIRQMLPVVAQVRSIQAMLEVKHSLGNYLAELGKLSGDHVYYKQAVQEFSSGLEVMPSDVTLDSAKFQVSAGQAYHELARLTGDQDYLNLSVANLREGMAALDRLGARDAWVTCVGSLANALTTMGEVTGRQGILEEAIDLHRLACDSVSRSKRPLTWALYKANLANAYRSYGKEFNLYDAFELGLAACNASLDERPRAQVPSLWADSQSIRGALLLVRGSLDGSQSDLELVAIERRMSSIYSCIQNGNRYTAARIWALFHTDRGDSPTRT